MNAGYANGIGTFALFNRPCGIVYDAANNMLYVADQGNSLIRSITLPGAVVSALAGGNGSIDQGWTNGYGTFATFNNPNGLTYDGSSGLLYVTDFYNSDIRAVSIATTAVSTIAGVPIDPGYVNGVGTYTLFNFPCGAEYVSNSDLIYVADSYNNVVRVLNATYPQPGASMSPTQVTSIFLSSSL